MTRRYSWPQYRQPWALKTTVTNLEGAVAEPEIVESTRRIRLDLSGEWSAVEFAFDLRTTEEPVDVEATTAYVLVSSVRTNTRIPAPLQKDGETAFVGSVLLDRATLAGAVTLQGQVLSSDGYVRVVGESEPWTVVADPSDAPPRPGAPPFDMVWCYFSSDEAPASVRSAADSYAVMDLSGPSPVLYLNDDIKAFRPILESTGAKLEKKRIRDVLGSSIARYALATLFREAMAQTTVEGDDFELPDDSLLQQVIRAVVDEAKSVSSPEELYAGLHDSGQRLALWIEVDNALDRLSDHAETVADALQKVWYA
jgi:hypothetical protein